MSAKETGMGSSRWDYSKKVLVKKLTYLTTLLHISETRLMSFFITNIGARNSYKGKSADLGIMLCDR